MKAKNEHRREHWLKPNRSENHGTTFSNHPARDRDSLMGLEAKTITTLRPTGEIRVKGRVYDAVAEGTFVDSGERVRITGSRDFRIVVERIV